MSVLYLMLFMEGVKIKIRNVLLYVEQKYIVLFSVVYLLSGHIKKLFKYKQIGTTLGFQYVFYIFF